MKPLCDGSEMSSVDTEDIVTTSASSAAAETNSAPACCTAPDCELSEMDGLDAGQQSTGGRLNPDGMAELDGTAESVDTTTSPWAGSRPMAFGELLADDDAWPQ